MRERRYKLKINTMETKKVYCKFYFDNLLTNRKRLFEEALKSAKNGKVLYITSDELEELPQLSQDFSSTNKGYLKLISFLYAKSIESLIESLSTLPDWQIVPSTIILDDISNYCANNSMQRACSVVALLMDSARSCSETLGTCCTLHISATSAYDDQEYYAMLQELFFNIS